MSEHVPIKAPLPAGGDALAIIPRDFEQVWRLAAMLAKTSMVPKDFRNKPEETAGAIMYGLEIGLSPIAAVQSIAVINGRPCLYGDALPALVRRHGHKLTEVVGGEGDKLNATVTLVRKDGEKITRSFSMADARRAGLANKGGPWKDYPQRMVQMRARSWAVRDGAAEILKGLAVAEEQSDAVMKDITPKPDVIEPPTPDAVDDLPPDPSPQDAPPAPDDETLADAVGALDKLKDELDGVKDEAIRAEIWDSYASLIERMTDADKRKAEAIFEGRR